MFFKRIAPYLELLALIGGALTVGTAYYLLFIAHPAWMALDIVDTITVFRELILRVGSSQILVSNVSVLAAIILFFTSRNYWWLVAVGLLLLSLPVTALWLMPINLQFLDEALVIDAPENIELLRQWGNYQIIRVITDLLAFIVMCKIVIWRKAE